MVHFVIPSFVLSQPAFEDFPSARTSTTLPSMTRSGRSILFVVAQHGDSSIPIVSSKSHPLYSLSTLARKGDSPTHLFQVFYALLVSQREIFSWAQSMFHFVTSCWPSSTLPRARSGTASCKRLFFQASEPFPGVGSLPGLVPLPGVGALAPTSEPSDQWASAPEETLLAFPAAWGGVYRIYSLRQYRRASGDPNGHDEER